MDDQYVLNHCTRYLARDADEPRHDFGQYEPGDPRARIADAWRYPIVDSYFDGTSVEASYPSTVPADVPNSLFMFGGHD